MRNAIPSKARHSIVTILVPILLLGSLSCEATVVSAQARAQRPNILWIVGENLALDLGCYGMQHVRTPNLDGLAAPGHALHPGLRHLTGLRTQSLGLHDGHVSNQYGYAPYALPSG